MFCNNVLIISLHGPYWIKPRHHKNIFQKYLLSERSLFILIKAFLNDS